MMIATECLKERPTKPEAVKRNDLQGMRAVAVLAVFADHTFGWPHGGFVGVDIFFVLSGFFITTILIRERASTGELSFRDFYIRRARRILPSALLVLAVTVGASNLLLTALRSRDVQLDALYAAVFAANFRFEALGADYFQQDQPPSPIQHYWSLSIEEQFYFVWPLLLLVIFTATRRRKRRGQEWVRQWGLFGGMFAIVASSFMWAMSLSASSPNEAYFSTFTRVWELGVGALTAIAGPWLLRLPDRLRPILAYMGLAGVTASLLVIESGWQFPAPWAALPVLSTATVIASFHGVQPRHVPVLTNPVARWFGDTSYTLYLWHWPVVVLLAAVVAPGATFYALAVALSLGLTAFTYHFYEDPIRKSQWLEDRPRRRRRGSTGRRKESVLTPRNWAFAGMLAAAMTVLAILNNGHSAKLQASLEEIRFAGSGQEQVDLTPEEVSDPCFGAPAMINDCPAVTDRELQPSIDKFAKDYPARVSDCFTERDQKLRSCVLGYIGEDATRIAVVGDSHAAFLLPALQRLLINNKWQLTTFIGTPCYLMDPAPDGCRATMRRASEALIAEPFDLVLVTNRNNEQDPGAYLRAWKPIIAAGSKLAVVADNPQTSKSAIACLTRVGSDIAGCGTAKDQAFARPDPLLEAARLAPEVFVIDLSRYYCREAFCPSVIGDVIVYSDTTHITATFSKTLSKAVEEGLRQALNLPPA